MSNGHRWSKFFWADWQTDEKLRLCSMAAQGLWMRALCTMHEAGGYLLIGCTKPTWSQLAVCWGSRSDHVERWMAELLKAGVAEQTEAGVIFCRRMVNDIKASDAGREHIKKRWSNSHPNREPNRGPNREPNSPPISPEAEADTEAENPPNPPTADAAGGLHGQVVSIHRKERRRERPAPRGGNAAAEHILRYGFETAPMLGGVANGYRPPNALRSSNDFIDSPSEDDALPAGGRHGQA